MGCDIHAFVEYRDSKNDERFSRMSWRSMGGRYHLSRDYTMFGFMAGVRGEGPSVVAPRGIPDLLDWATEREYYYRIDDAEAEKYGHGYDEDSRRCVTLERAQEWAKYGSKIIYEGGEPYQVSGPDWHTPSWLTPDEFDEAYCRTKIVYNTSRSDDYLYSYRAVSALMNSLSKDGFHVRLVFWFDN